MENVDYVIPKKRLPPDAEVNISDTTLRDGCQMPGIYISETQKLRIFEYLHLIGIEKLECFVFSPSDRSVAHRMLDRGYAFPEITAWSRANKDDLDIVAGIGGIKEVGILMSVSDLHIFKKIGFSSREAAENSYLDALSHALDKGLAVRCHLEDVTRADFNAFVAPLVEKILEMNQGSIIRVCDTVGIGLPDPDMELPLGIPRLVRALKEIGAKNIETHMHDDFGNAMANSMIGFDYGANWTSAAFLGIGERAGNAKMEEILINLQHIEGLENRYNLECLIEFAEFMEMDIGVCLPGNKAVVGKNAFAHKSSIHAAAVIKDPSIYEPFPPEMVGAKRRLLVGPTSGFEIVTYKVNEILAQLGSNVRVSKQDKRIKAIFTDMQEFFSRGDRRNGADISYDEMKLLVEKNILGAQGIRHKA